MWLPKLTWPAIDCLTAGELGLGSITQAKFQTSEPRKQVLHLSVKGMRKWGHPMQVSDSKDQKAWNSNVQQQEKSVPILEKTGNEFAFPQAFSFIHSVKCQIENKQTCPGRMFSPLIQMAVSPESTMQTHPEILPHQMSRRLLIHSSQHLILKSHA